MKQVNKERPIPSSLEKFWQGLNVFVTGASGFIGSWVTKSLVEMGANVSILIRDIPTRRFEFMNQWYQKLEGVVFGDLNNYSLLCRILNDYEIDTCFHLAAQTIVGKTYALPMSAFESNIKGSWNLLEALRNSKSTQRIVMASSDKVYGEPQKAPIPEEHPLLATDPYGGSKVCVEILSGVYYETYGLPLALTRCANVYGGGDLNFSRIVPGTIRSCLLDKNPTIRSDGSPIRDYMYVDDVVEAYLLLAMSVDKAEVRGQAFNFGTEQPTSVINLVNKILKIGGKNDLKPQILGKSSNEINIQYLSSKKAETILKWKAKFSLEKGLTETVEWYRKNLNWICGVKELCKP